MLILNAIYFTRSGVGGGYSYSVESRSLDVYEGVA